MGIPDLFSCIPQKQHRVRRQINSTQDALKCYCLYDYGNCILTTYFILTGVIKRNALTTETTKKEYEDSVRVWFSNARDREGGRDNRPRSHHVVNSE